MKIKHHGKGIGEGQCKNCSNQLKPNQKRFCSKDCEEKYEAHKKVIELEKDEIQKRLGKRPINIIKN